MVQRVAERRGVSALIRSTVRPVLWAFVVVAFLHAREAAAQQYPILFVHGFCSNSSTWDEMFDNLPTRRVGDELVRYHQDANGHVTTQANSPTTGQAFSIDFVDSTGSFENARAVADVSIVDKAGQLKAVIDQIKVTTGSPKVILVTHSMGGLVARSYVQGSSRGLTGQDTAYEGDVAGLITIDTPHQGALWTGIAIGQNQCVAAGTVNKMEMHPTQSQLLPELNHRRHNWPLGTRLDAIVSYRDPLIGDGVVSRASQDIEEVGEYWATHPYIQSYPRVFASVLQGGQLLHNAVLEFRVTAALVQGLIQELDAAAAEALSLSGAVRVTNSNLPIAGARVLFLDGPNAGRSVTTNAAGEFRFDGLVAGNSNLSVTAPGYLEVRAGLFVDRQAGLQFLLAPAAPITTAAVTAAVNGVPGYCRPWQLASSIRSEVRLRRA
jgi:pimeloyl-ACP methyl ester carboxylesterase